MAIFYLFQKKFSAELVQSKFQMILTVSRDKVNRNKFVPKRYSKCHNCHIDYYIFRVYELGRSFLPLTYFYTNVSAKLALTFV